MGDWFERHSRDRELPFGILRHHPFRLILVALDDETCEPRAPEKGQHMAAREAGDEGLLGIDGARIGIRSLDDIRRRGCGNRQPSVERPAMRTRIFLSGEIAAIALPSDACRMMRHVRTASYRVAMITAALPIATAL